MNKSLLQKLVSFVRAKIDDPLLEVAAHGSRYIYRRYGLPSPEFTALYWLVGHSVVALSGFFQLAMAISHFQAPLVMAGAMGVIVGLPFAMVSYVQLQSSPKVWNYRRFREASAQASINREKYLFVRIGDLTIVLSLFPLVYWSLFLGAKANAGLMLVTLQIAIAGPFLILSDYVYAAEPPHPDDGDFALDGLPQAT
jgi:hypothetical protein